MDSFDNKNNINNENSIMRSGKNQQDLRIFSPIRRKTIVLLIRPTEAFYIGTAMNRRRVVQALLRQAVLHQIRRPKAALKTLLSPGRRSTALLLKRK